MKTHKRACCDALIFILIFIESPNLRSSKFLCLERRPSGGCLEPCVCWRPCNDDYADDDDDDDDDDDNDHALEIFFFPGISHLKQPQRVQLFKE